MHKVEAISVILADIMKADAVVRLEEMNAGRRIVSRLAKETDLDPALCWSRAIETTDLSSLAINVIRKLETSECTRIIECLWEMAISDTELHDTELDYIRRLSARLGVDCPRLDNPPRPLRMRFRDQPETRL